MVPLVLCRVGDWMYIYLDESLKLVLCLLPSATVVLGGKVAQTNVAHKT